MNTSSRSLRRATGFSLIEVMIAVLVLAVGLLALVALQGNLVRSGADAKARSRVAALVVSRLDAARASGYYAIADTDVTRCVNAAPADICSAQAEAAITDLALGQAVDTATGANDSEYKTVTVSASWRDAAGDDRSLAMSTVVSPLSLDATNTLLNQQLSGDTAKTPIVRTDSPATDGVVPIALGDGSSSAASNPTPELVGKANKQETIATRFDVLTYIPSGSSAQIQKRIETAVIKCSCQYGEGGTKLPEIYQTAQWPAVWTGERYEVYKPSNGAAAPGASKSAGPVSTVTQSALCTECCRDHHDSGATGVPRFDPERSSGTSKYYRDNKGDLKIQSNTATGEYINACRMIRVDGLWRTAADMYARNVGLLETQSVSNVQAKSGLPTTAATEAYATFVKSYLAQYTGSTSSAPTNAQTLFDAVQGLNDPTTVSISTPDSNDRRYLHLRGLYVDYLEDEAREKIADVLADTDDGGACESGKALSDCVMPYLPFTSANLTEIATWASSDSTTLVVNSSGTLATDPEQPSGGRSYGVKNGSATNTATVRNSNSGLAVSSVLTFTGVDDGDLGTSSDAQGFTIGTPTSGGGTKDKFYVSNTGAVSGTQVTFTVGGLTQDCITSGSVLRCDTNSTAPLSGSLLVRSYGRENTNTTKTVTVTSTQCSSKKTGFPGGTYSITNFPTWDNYAITSALVSGTSDQLALTVSGDNTSAETTSVAFSGLAAEGTINLVYALQNTRQDATVKTCTASYSSKTKTWSITVDSWNYPWR